MMSRERSHNPLSKEGAIYRCKTNVANSCYMLPFDKRGTYHLKFRFYYLFQFKCFALTDDWHEIRDQYGIYYSENKTNQLLGATLKVSNDVVLVNNFLLD